MYSGKIAVPRGEVVYDLNVITFINDIYGSLNLVVGRKILLDIVSD
jgi:isocitrate lyase